MVRPQVATDVADARRGDFETERPLRVLFIPVSAPRGTGEYARAREIATAVLRRWPRAEVHFVLNQAAPYAGSVPFPTTWLPSSATYHPAKVASLIREFRPTLVIFDNAGRTAQLKAAREVGARIVFVSSRLRQRRKAFRLRWMRLIDEHWIAWPQFVAGSLSVIERLKLALLRRPVVRYLDTVMPEPSALESEAVMKRFGLRADGYVLVVPGGGTGHPGAEDAPEIVADAASRLAARGQQTLLVGGSRRSTDPETSLLLHAPRLDMAELTALIRKARLVVTNGGDTLMQVLACKRACVAVPIAHDQAFRIERCRAAGLVLGVPLDAGRIEHAALSLLGDSAERTGQLAVLSRHRIVNGLEAALEAIAALTAR